MAKHKMRPLFPAPIQRRSNSVFPVVDLLGEDDWIVVQRQKVSILIPPLPVAERSIMPNQGEVQPEVPKVAIIEDSPSPATIISQKHSAPERDMSLKLTPESAIPVPKTHPQSTLSSPKLPTPRNMPSGNVQPYFHSYKNSGYAFSAQKTRKQVLILNDGKPLLNHRMRAINIDKKIREAGGLSSWLISLGLERFVKIFHQKRVNRFQLASLTMKKLKDMGAIAVGPRRKLIHALDCLCQPYCFQHI